MIKSLNFENKLIYDDITHNMHFHNTWEINVIFTDGVDILVNDKYYTSKSGDVFIFPAYSFHRTNLNKVKYNRFLIFFDEFEIDKCAGILMQPLRFLKNSGINLVHMNADDAETIKKMLSDAYLIQSKHGLFTDFEITCAFGNILRFIIDKTDINKTLTHDKHNEMNNNLISSILTYVSQNIDTDLSVQTICSEFGISKSTLWNIMKSETGLSMKEFIVNMRISRATHLLLNNYTVTEVSNLCGFNSYAHFIRIFTKKIGVSPNQYRKNMLERE